MFQMRILRNGSKALIAAVLTAAAAGGVAHAQNKNYPPYSIMAPEPGVRPDVQPPREPQRAEKPVRQPRRVRGSSTLSTIPTYQSPVKPLGVAPRSIDGPRLTSQPAVPTPVPGFATVPSPPTSLSGQSFQDRAIGCAHYGASQGVGAGQIGAYTGGCVNTR